MNPNDPMIFAMSQMDQGKPIGYECPVCHVRVMNHKKAKAAHKTKCGNPPKIYTRAELDARDDRMAQNAHGKN